MRTKRIFAVITAAIVISCGIGFTNAEAAELKLKQSGSEVKALQLELITLGYLDNAHPTGYYGEATKKAVASFQKDNGLKADGIAGSKTTSAIKKKLIKPDITKVYGPGDVSEEVSALQQLLVKKGYLASFSVSGVYGEVTRNAVKKYQADNKLKSDGIAGRNTLAKLKNGVTDTAVTKAAKCLLRNDKPLLIALATNDALGATFVNLAELRNRKCYHFVPMSPDDAAKKPNSMICDFTRVKEISDTIWG